MIGAGLWEKDPRKQEGGSGENEEEQENALEVAAISKRGFTPQDV